MANQPKRRAVDHFLDMGRTMLSFVGDLVPAQFISAGEPKCGELAMEAAPRPG